MENAARLYYGEVWAGGSLDLLDELAAAGVCFNDALGMEADAFSRASLKSIIQEFQASHPLLKFDLVSGMCYAGLMSRVLVLCWLGESASASVQHRNKSAAVLEVSGWYPGWYPFQCDSAVLLATRQFVLANADASESSHVALCGSLQDHP